MEIEHSGKSVGEHVVEFGEWATRVTLDIIGLAGMGRDFNAVRNDDDPLVGAYNELLEPTTERAVYFAANIVGPQDLIQKLPWKQNRVLRETTGKLKYFCLRMVREKREKAKLKGEGGNDILSLLIESNNFSDEELVDQMLTFLAAGCVSLFHPHFSTADKSSDTKQQAAPSPGLSGSSPPTQTGKPNSATRSESTCPPSPRQLKPPPMPKSKPSPSSTQSSTRHCVYTPRYQSPSAKPRVIPSSARNPSQKGPVFCSYRGLSTAASTSGGRKLRSSSLGDGSNLVRRIRAVRRAIMRRLHSCMDRGVVLAWGLRRVNSSAC